MTCLGNHPKQSKKCVTETVVQHLNSAKKPPLSNSTGSCEILWNTNKHLCGHFNPEKYSGLNPAPAWITARKGQTGPSMPKHSGTLKIHSFCLLLSASYTHTHTEIILLSHCTGFPGNWTSFLKLYAARLIRRLILPWLWRWCAGATG